VFLVADDQSEADELARKYSSYCSPINTAPVPFVETEIMRRFIRDGGEYPMPSAEVSGRAWANSWEN
jgi:hypothetical protein